MALKLYPFLGPNFTYIPADFKNLTSLEEFKTKIKTWEPENCPCRL